LRPTLEVMGKLREVLGADRVKLAVKTIEVPKPKWPRRA